MCIRDSTGGVPLVGLRLSVSYLVVTVGFGVTYAFDRTEGWFGLLPHRVLSHAHLGLLGWLGLTYVSVAERLWPMFLLAHRPSQRSGAVSYTHLRAHETVLDLVCRLLLEKKKNRPNPATTSQT